MNGFRSRIGEIKEYLRSKDNNVILVMNDTRLRKNLKNMDLPGYDIIREDKPTNEKIATAGGVAIAVPVSWTCLRVNLNFKNASSESLAAIIIPPNSKPFKVATTYNRPGNHFPRELLKEFINITFNGKKVPGLYVGDFNSPHVAFGSRFSNVFGSSLLDALNQHSLVFYNDGNPTYHNSASGEANVLDLVLGESNMSRLVYSCEVGEDIGTDHLPVVTTLQSKVLKKEKRSVINMDLWAEKLSNCVSEMVSNNLSIDEEIDKLESIFQCTKAESSSVFKKEKRNLPYEIRYCIKMRKDLMKRRKRAQCEDERKILNREYNQINHKVQFLIKEYDRRKVEKLSTDICETNDTSKMWNLFKKHRENHEDKSEPKSPLVTPAGLLTESEDEICKEFSRHLRLVHQTPPNPLFDESFKDRIDNEMQNDESHRTKVNDQSIENVGIKSFRNLLSLTKTKSAAGEDGITYAVMKLCTDSCIKRFCQLLNRCLEENYFPRKWKKAKVTMVPKPGRDKTKASSYRPISLLSCLGKIYERHICNHLIAILKEKKFINDIQSGFWKGRSTQEHLFRLSQDIFNGFKKRECTVAIFLDVQAAFDSVWRNGLKAKIKKIGLPSQLENLLFSFLNDRSLKVFLGESQSDEVPLDAGTPQGSCLSPILYLIFVNDAPEVFDLSKVAASQYADDNGLWKTTYTLKEAEIDLQEAISNLQKWCERWQVTLNPLKSKLVIFSKCPRHKEELINITLFNQKIPIVSEADFLGVTFDSRLTWEPQVRKILARAYSRLNLIRAISGLSESRNVNLLLKLYKSVVRPIFEYSSVCIVNAADIHMIKLQQLQNQAMRVILKLPAYIPIKNLHDATGLEPIHDHLVKFAKSQVLRFLRKSPNMEKTVACYNEVKHVIYNRSLMDILQL